MAKTFKLQERLRQVETTEEHHGYNFSVRDALTMVILVSFCGLKNTSQVHQWASNSRVKEFLFENFWYSKNTVLLLASLLLCLLKLVKPESFNECFIRWFHSVLPETLNGYTLSLDGKPVRSTGKMQKYSAPLHIVSAHIAEIGITFAQQTVYDKSNEIPSVSQLLDMLAIEGCIVVADALNCQKETAKVIIAGKADYLLSVKDNHETLKQDIEDYIQDDELQKTMNLSETLEKTRIG